MDCKNIFQQRESAKFGVLISREGFSMESDDFEIELSWGFSGRTLKILKDDCVFGVDGYAYFIFNTENMVGRVVARCSYRMQDSDSKDGFRIEVDEQYLCFVATDPLPRFACVPALDMCEHYVTYQSTNQSGVGNKYEYLASVEGDRFITKETEFILVLRDLTNNE